MRFFALLLTVLPLIAAIPIDVEKRQGGTLSVYVVNSACLESEDLITKTEPYITVAINGGAEQRTQKTGDGTTFTIYGETLTFPNAPANAVIDIVAKDADVIRDDTIGKGSVDISKVDISKPITVELKHLAGLANAGIVTIFVTRT
ncbi:hypothetical protein DFS34DRAFT_226701 [Phlyctochytrium arcticum]|nr:hypothetical protein DFS34DRAFT_226701 [Phlyctochytrium arcticum]